MGLFGRKLDFEVKSCFKYFCEVSDFERIRVSCFEIGKCDFTVEYDRFK